MKAIEQVYPGIQKPENGDGNEIVLSEENPGMYIKGRKLHISHNGYLMMEMTVDNIFKELLAMRLRTARGKKTSELHGAFLNFLKETKLKAS